MVAEVHLVGCVRQIHCRFALAFKCAADTVEVQDLRNVLWGGRICEGPTCLTLAVEGAGAAMDR